MQQLSSHPVKSVLCIIMVMVSSVLGSILFLVSVMLAPAEQKLMFSGSGIFEWLPSQLGKMVSPDTAFVKRKPKNLPVVLSTICVQPTNGRQRVDMSKLAVVSFYATTFTHSYISSNLTN